MREYGEFRCSVTCARYTFLVMWIIGTILYIFDVIYGYIHCEHNYKWAIFVTIPFYILFSVLYLWSWYVTCLGDPGSLLNFYKEKGILDQIESGNIPDSLQTLPLCPRCGLPKPKRCHHCSECNRCHFRFDHHCPVIGNCVGLYNIKAFILLPIHGGFVIAVFAAETWIAHNFLVGIMLLLVGLIIAFASTVWLFTICSNQTSLEEIGNMKQKGEDYNLGCWSNWTQICSFPDCCLPTRPPVDGFYWSDAEVENYVNSLSSRH